MFKDKEKEKGAGFTLNLKTLVNLALLTALYVVLERFLSINMWNMRIGFAFIALALSGMLYGPVAAGLVGAAGDILGMLLFPTGPYFPGFTLNAFLTGAVYHNEENTGGSCGQPADPEPVRSDALDLHYLWRSLCRAPADKDHPVPGADPDPADRASVSWQTACDSGKENAERVNYPPPSLRVEGGGNSAINWMNGSKDRTAQAIGALHGNWNYSDYETIVREDRR